jgi:RimJ/RimL family protein N-acetyltransferase
VTYRERVTLEFERLKRPGATPIPITGGSLVPVCRARAADERLIAALARWRDANAFAYPTRFPVTQEGTATWLRDRVLAVPERIMFLVHDAAARPIGHAGFALTDDAWLKLDNVMRGEDGTPGIMTAAVKSLLGWAERTLGPAAVRLPVFAHNDRAIRFYRRIGFRETGIVPLRRIKCGERIEYVPLTGTGPADAHHLIMVRQPPT